MFSATVDISQLKAKALSPHLAIGRNRKLATGTTGLSFHCLLLNTASVAQKRSESYFNVYRRRCLSSAFMTMRRDLEPSSSIRVVGLPWYSAASPVNGSKTVQEPSCSRRVEYRSVRKSRLVIDRYGQVQVNSNSFSAARRARIAAAMKTRDRP